MNSQVCADASLALKLIFHEEDSAQARALWEEWKSQQVIVIAPSLWAYEVTSVIRNRAHRGQLTPDMEEEAFNTVDQLPIELARPSGLHKRAWELAKRFERPSAYDAHYIALAEMADCPFWTADERLFNAVRGQLDWVHWLGNYR